MSNRSCHAPRGRPFVVTVKRDGPAWLVVTCRGHGWLHGGFDEAFLDAVTIAAGFGGFTVVSS
jgi:hypothetical protein